MRWGGKKETPRVEVVFAWKPVFLSDKREMAWLERVHRITESSPYPYESQIVVTYESYPPPKGVAKPRPPLARPTGHSPPPPGKKPVECVSSPAPGTKGRF